MVPGREPSKCKREPDGVVETSVQQKGSIGSCGHGGVGARVTKEEHKTEKG